MTNIVFLNGKFVPYKRAVVPISTHALHYGTGCFEGIRGYWNSEQKKLYVFRLADHYRRLARSCRTLSMRLPTTTPQLCRITIELLKRCRHKTGVYIRPLVYKSDPTVTRFNLKKLADGFAILTEPLGHYLDVSSGITAITSVWLRVSARMIPPFAKPTGIYLNTALAKTEAENRGADEAILTNPDGSISEGSAENIFLVKAGCLHTPSLDQNILEGITRNTIIELAKKELGISTIQRKIMSAELTTADEVFLTGTGAEVTPVIEINSRKIGSGRVGPITRRLQDLYFQIVNGQNPKYARWLSKI
ncbi:MAG: branched-chain amino acid transaminase [Patescibacteria group bacterium]